MNRHDRISPALFACGVLINSLANSKCLVKLSFFCDLHTDIRDANTGGLQLRMNLIGQLLKQHSGLALSVLETSQQRKLEDHDVELPSKLLKSLPEASS